MQILLERELATIVCLYMYDNLTDIIDISSLPGSLFSTSMELSTSPIEFPFTTSNSIFSFYLRWGKSFYEFPFIISFGWNGGNRFYKLPFTICLGLDGGNHFMNLLSPSFLYIIFWSGGNQFVCIIQGWYLLKIWQWGFVNIFLLYSKLNLFRSSIHLFL